MEGGWVAVVVDGEHAGGGGACLAHGVAGLEDGDGGAAMVELERERKADDAGAGDEEIWMGTRVWHRVSLFGLRETRDGVSSASRMCLSLVGNPGLKSETWGTRIVREGRKASRPFR